MKFIHMGDVHLGAEPESGTYLGPIRKREIWESFREVIGICERDEVDLLLIPGDLFHGQPLLKEVKEVSYLFGTLSKTKVVLIAGNHDCLLETSHYYDVVFPENVTFLMDTQEDSVYFPEWNTEVFGLSYERKQISEPRYDRLRVTDENRINILLAHGNILGGDKSIPIKRSAIEEAGFDYAALGHLHTRIEVSDRIAYSGGFEPFDKKETGEKGYLSGEITKQGKKSEVRFEFVVHARRQYVRLDVEVSPEMTEFSAAEKAYGQMAERGLQHMYLVSFCGKRAGEWSLRTDTIRETLLKRGCHVIEIADVTTPDFSVEELLREHDNDFIGNYIRTLLQEKDKEIAAKAIEYGLQALLETE